MATYLAFDLGAASGRAIIGNIENSRLELSEIHRFHSGAVKILGHYHWPLVRLFEEMLSGLHKCHESDLKGIGICTWGVDYALLNRYDEFVNLPYSYRDGRTEGIMEKVFEIIPKSDIYQLTGNQFMPLNTLYQLYAQKLYHPEDLITAKTLLMIPDLLNFWMTGEKVAELTNASTTQFLNAESDIWCSEIFNRLELPINILPKIYKPGSFIGELNLSVQEETGLGDIPVIAPATHDTASAFASIPAQSENYSFISSGTWSLIGTETRHPVICDEGLKNNITNERTPGNRNMLRKNIMGLWLVQESMRVWNDSGKNYTNSLLVKMANETKSIESFIEPDHPSFFQPGDMPKKIREFCIKSGQTVPSNDGELTHCIFESLALKYRWVLDIVEKIKGAKSNILHVVGGGSKNALLCQMTANVTGKTVIAGPVEATAIGNIMMQALADGTFSSIEEGKKVIASSFDLKSYNPQDEDTWHEKYAIFEKIKETTDTII
jgi:sugar (pentulose or hexulose) kinase